MNLRSLSDDQLHSLTIFVAQRERAVTVSLLKHLAEVRRRHLFAKFNGDSLDAYCVDHLKMSDTQAGRRVSASRLLNELWNTTFAQNTKALAKLGLEKSDFGVETLEIYSFKRSACGLAER